MKALVDGPAHKTLHGRRGTGAGTVPSAYDAKRAALANVHGGGGLVDQREREYRRTLNQVVRDYPEATKQLEIHRRERELQEQREDDPHYGSLDALLRAEYVDEEKEFEKLLARTLLASSDHNAVLRIFQRKLGVQSKGKAEGNLKILEEMLEREPLKMFAVRGSLCYLSSKMAGQMDALAEREGNEEELYKDDATY